MSKLTELANDAAQAVGDAGRFVKRNVEAGAKAANDTGKAVAEKVDTATKPVQDFASAAGNKATKLARAAGRLYLRHRERIDTAPVGYALGAQVASSHVARTVATKLLGAAAAGSALGAAPVILAITGFLYGPKIYKVATDFLSAEKTYDKVKNGDKGAIKDLIDTIAEAVAKETPEADADKIVQSLDDLSPEEKSRIKELAKAIEAGEEIIPEELDKAQGAEDAPAAPANDDQRDNGAPAP